MEQNLYKNSRVLVTGAGGFIASHLVEQLVIQGATVRAFVRYNSRGDIGLLRFIPEQVLRQVEVRFGDLRDYNAVVGALKGTDVVFHLGALIAIPYSYLHPREVVETNVLGTLNVLQACREIGISRLVHTSTSEVYGTGLYTPMDEKHPLHAQSPYAASKIGADKLVESFYCTYDLSAVTVRPFNTFGPRQSARAVIPTIISQALTSERIRIGNLTTKRDFTFVLDTVRGFLLAGSVPGVEGETFNLGTGKEVTVGELIDRVAQILGKELIVEQERERFRPEKSEVMRLLSDFSKAQMRLGWAPEWTLSKGLKQTLEWIQEHLSSYPNSVYQR
ncbi:GDP-mannose 4,6-dehydratase [Anaerolinea thermophila]|uniref:NAD-dependent epimerase/dehydratase family protein n=1 Tax=Anaerolinea thermophila (strain DSM 14523 / JCM 11388 / NBRC 100420 / UNI-1) TaxID=926569 RepID=E8N5L9_ANATU|nr:GDP-mannose 4,6-dehydratase [Anaerolinea thermophila]BAJ63733.1 NAD-dependent epimerase/dehydratase family protein [Anaerolinea thermophila UNI-1]